MGESHRAEDSIRHDGRISLSGALRLKLDTPYSDQQLLVRLITDLLLVNLGLFLGFVTTVFYHILFSKGPLQPDWIRATFLRDWLQNVPVFTALCLLVFLYSNLYGRAPNLFPVKRFLSAFRAVSLAFLGQVLFLYFTQEASRSVLPASALLSGWVFSISLVGGVRVARNIFFKRYKVVPRRGVITSRISHVLVIGGAGYLGSTLVRRLLGEGYQVRVLDSLLFGEESIRELHSHKGFELMVGDFRNVEMTVRAIRGVEAVIHLGALVGDPACEINEDITVDINTNAVRMIREACRGYGISRFLFASTCSVYGAQDKLINESSELAPVSYYAKSKIDAERAILELVDEDFRPTILRLGTAFGQSYRMRFDLVVNLLTARAVKDGHITIYNGHQWRPFIHVRDIARAFQLCLRAPLDEVGAQVLNTGDSRQNLTLNELANVLSRVIPSVEVHHESNDTDSRSYRVDFTKIERAIGFSCNVSMEDGILEMTQAIRQGKIKAWEDPIYNNAAVMYEGTPRAPRTEAAARPEPTISRHPAS